MIDVASAGMAPMFIARRQFDAVIDLHIDAYATRRR